MVVPLVPKASYTVPIPLSLFYVLDASEPLEAFRLQTVRIANRTGCREGDLPAVRLSQPQHDSVLGGKLVSNVLQLPR